MPAEHAVDVSFISLDPWVYVRVASIAASTHFLSYNNQAFNLRVISYIYHDITRSRIPRLALPAVYDQSF